MAAYQSSRHEATQFTPNYLMMGREVRDSDDTVYGSPESEQHNSYDDYADKLHHRLLQAYSFARQHLQEAPERSKHYYDLRVRPQRYKVGTSGDKINGNVSLPVHSWLLMYQVK